MTEIVLYMLPQGVSAGQSKNTSFTLRAGTSALHAQAWQVERPIRFGIESWPNIC